MKKLMLCVVATLLITACSQPKDIYFNGGENSHSGMKYDKASGSFKVNK